MTAPAARFVLYSEDSARDALEVLRHLLHGMLRHIRPDVKMNHVEIEPALQSDERVTGSMWKTHEKSRNSQYLRRLLVRAIATAMARDKIVFFHVDADASWSSRATCDNLQLHWRRLCSDVHAVWGQGTDANLAARLILVMPFHEIESWAFANTRRLHELLTDPRDRAALAEWENDLKQLDEIPDIKDRLTLRDTRNSELVQRRHGFPVDELVAAQTSYAATVSRLRDSAAVQQGLRTAAERPY